MSEQNGELGKRLALAESPKVAALLDKYRIAIKISQEFVTEHDIKKGDSVMVAAETVDITDPDDASNILGHYTSYKEKFYVTSIRENFLIATKYETVSNFPQLALFSNKKELTDYNHDVSNELLTETDKPVEVGDVVSFR